MGMMVAARRIEAGTSEVRYEFGFEDRFNRILMIDPSTLEASVEDGDFNSAASAITAKIVSSWRSSGEFPARMFCAADNTSVSGLPGLPSWRTTAGAGAVVVGAEQAAPAPGISRSQKIRLVARGRRVRAAHVHDLVPAEAGMTVGTVRRA
ncbi:hypothetical protein [Micromonospora sp. CPCC 205556]|uniref:hypothetical protein n=1 Tax=Micromonospora sp. CPCC 205556 TaxID=3122398 RepID=UPI002FF16BC4